jgi:hypothetical protein
MKRLILLFTVLLLSACTFLEEEYVTEDGITIPVGEVITIDTYKDWAYDAGIYRKVTLSNDKESRMIDFLNALDVKRHSEEVDNKGSYYSVIVNFDNHEPVRVDFLDMKRGVIKINDLTYILLENDLTYIKTIEFGDLIIGDENIESLYEYLNIPEDYLYSQISKFEMDDGFIIYRIPNLSNNNCFDQVEFFIDDHFYSGVKGCSNNFESFDFYAARDGAVYDLRELIENNLINQSRFHKDVYTKYLFDDH